MIKKVMTYNRDNINHDGNGDNHDKGNGDGDDEGLVGGVRGVTRDGE